MPSMNPISTEAKPFFRRSSSETQPLFSPASTVGSPRSSAPKSPIFARIRSSRSRSPSTHHATVPSPSVCSTPTPSRTSSTLSVDDRLPRSNSTSSTFSQSQRARSRSQKRNSGTTMAVGRHGNDWLFGGFSFTEAVKCLLSSSDNDH